MKRIILLFFIASFYSASAAEKLNTPMLSGDRKLACESILYLSSSVGSRLFEYMLSLKIYFNIDKPHKKMSFLNLIQPIDLSALGLSDEGVDKLKETDLDEDKTNQQINNLVNTLVTRVEFCKPNEGVNVNGV